MSQKKFSHEKLKTIRRSTGNNQKEVASVVGVSPGYYCQLEQGKRGPSFHIAVRIAEVLACSLEDFLVTGTQEPRMAYPSVGDDIRNWIT